jgi:tetratricopeptide (TPR) repeat protein
MIYLLQPLHVEVVASVKSRDELLAALFGFMAWNSYLKSSENNFKKISDWILPAAFLMLALLSKESAIVFLVILPLSVWQLKGKEIKKIIAPGLPLLLAVISFLWIRHQIVGTVSAGRGIAALDNVLSLAQGTSELWATKMEILAKYLQLLFIPWPLSWDYSNAQIPLVGWIDYRALIGLIAHLVLLGVAIWGFRKWAVISFSILFYLISTSPTNNLFFLNGATVAERFLFVPSFGYALLLGWGVYQLLSRYQPDLKKATNYYRITIGIIALIYCFIISSRIPDWSSNMRLFESGVKASPNSSKANQAYATELENRARESQNPAERAVFTEKAMRYFHQSLAIMPGNADAALKLGQIHDMEGRKDSAVIYYQRSIAVKPQYYIALNNLGAIYAGRKQFDLALDCFRRSYQADTAQELTLINLMVVHYNKQQKDSVRYFGNKALGLGFENPKIQELMR